MAKQHMRYEWEADTSHKNVASVGVLYVNRKTAEAACHIMDDALPPRGSVERADLLKDMLGDIEAAYHDALEGMREEFNAARKAAN